MDLEMSVSTDSHEASGEENIRESRHAFTDAAPVKDEPANVKEKPYQCDLCDKTFTQSVNLNRHLRIHSGDKPFKCFICSKCFNQSQNLKTHLRVHSKDKDFLCSECGESFADFSSFNIHVAQDHNKFKSPGKSNSMVGVVEEKPFSCNVCDKSFTQSGNLKRHMLTHTNEKPHQCHICQKAFGQSGNLQKHMRIHNDEKPFTCALCEKSFTQSQNLKRHLNIIHGDVKLFKCNQCDQCFSENSGLLEHKQKDHDGDKPYRCHICMKGFSVIEALNEHILSHGRKKSEKKCGKLVELHIESLEPSKKDSEGEETKCLVCLKMFSCDESLQTHLRTHIISDSIHE